MCRVMSLHDEFLAEVETFLTLTGMKPSRFGAAVVNNPNFVFGLRKGSPSPTAKTIDRVREFIRDYRPDGSQPQPVASAA